MGYSLPETLICHELSGCAQEKMFQKVSKLTKPVDWDVIFLVFKHILKNDSQSVIDIFNRLYLELRPDIFIELFPVLLADNGSEFSNPSAIEFDT